MSSFLRLFSFWVLSSGALASASPSGAEIFDAKCATCHTSVEAAGKILGQTIEANYCLNYYQGLEAGIREREFSSIIAEFQIDLCLAHEYAGAGPAKEIGIYRAAFQLRDGGKIVNYFADTMRAARKSEHFRGLLRAHPAGKGALLLTVDEFKTLKAWVEGPDAVAYLTRRNNGRAPELEMPEAELTREVNAHAERCEQMLGIDRIPDLQCFDPRSKEIPITLTDSSGTIGIVDPARQPAERWRHVYERTTPWTGPLQKCDRPTHLNTWTSGACVPHHRVLRTDYKGTQWVMICRTNEAESRHPNTFNDVAVIGYRPSTGATCFMNSQLKPYKIDDDKHRIPAPRSDKAGVFWQAPAKLPCLSCHTNDPFIHTPWIDQVKGEDGRSIVPYAPFGRFFVIGERLGSTHVPRKIELDPRALSTEEARKKGACFRCHGTSVSPIALGKPCDLVSHAAFLTGERSYSGNPFLTDAFRTFPKSHWMPPSGAGDLAAWRETYQESAEFIHDCCRDPGTRGCRWSPLSENFFRVPAR